MTPSSLPDHPAFLRLGPDHREILLRGAEVWEADEGDIIYHSGDSAEDLILLLSGRLETADRVTGERRWLPGELWGEDRLADPEPLERALLAAADSRWLRWTRRGLAATMAASTGLQRGLQPVLGAGGELVSGLESLPTISDGGGSTRKFRSSLRPAVAGLFLMLPATIFVAILGLRFPTLPAFVALVPAALYVGWFLVFLFVRLLSDYRIQSDGITSRSFDWTRFAVESRHVPVDRIQGVEAEQNGPVRRIFGYGNVIVKTSALEGELLIRDTPRPKQLAAEIAALREQSGRRTEGRDRESLRRSLEQSGFTERAPRLVRPADTRLSAPVGSGGNLRFRKSVAVLVGRLMLPSLVTLLPLLAAPMISGLLASVVDIPAVVIRLCALLPLFWSWYVFEDWRNDSFRVSGGYAVDLYRKPLGLKESRRQVELASVQNIRTEQNGPLAVLFRFGDVILVTAGGASDTVFRNVSRPWKVQQVLFREREEGLKLQAERQLEERKDDLMRFAEAMDQVRGH